MGDLALETQFSLAILGTVSVGSLILLLVQTIKQLWPSLEGQTAVWVTFVVANVAMAIAFRQLDADLTDPDVLLALVLGACGAFLSALFQYAFLFKRSVEGLPPPPNAEAPIEAFSDPEDDDLPEVDDAEPMTVEQQRAAELVTDPIPARNLRKRIRPSIVSVRD